MGMSNVVQMQKRHLIRSGANVIQLPKLENGTTKNLRYGFFLPDDRFLNAADKFQECKNNGVH